MNELSEYLNFHISNDDMIRISTKLDQHCRNDTHELMKNDRHYSHENSKHLQAYHSCMQTLRFPQQTTTNDGRGTFLLLFIILLFSFHTIRVARIVYQFILTAVFLNQKENVKAFSVPGFFFLLYLYRKNDLLLYSPYLEGYFLRDFFERWISS